MGPPDGGYEILMETLADGGTETGLGMGAATAGRVCWGMWKPRVKYSVSRSAEEVVCECIVKCVLVWL